MLIILKKQILEKANPKKAKILQRFFKTGKGEYGENDFFLGLTVPEQRKIAKKYQELSINFLQELLNSKFHEHRLIALLILIEKYKKLKEDIEKKKIVDFYLANTKNINNWDLVDLSADKLLGDFLYDKLHDNLYNNISNNKEIARDTLLRLAKSNNLWEKRISIISTFYFIKKGKSDYTFEIAEILLNDKHDLIHKAVGWMLREIGKRISIEKEEEFLKKHYKKMPRTMLRYAIEKFAQDKRQKYMRY